MSRQDRVAYQQTGRSKQCRLRRCRLQLPDRLLAAGFAHRFGIGSLIGGALALRDRIKASRKIG
jgi:hypothetical protein